MTSALMEETFWLCQQLMGNGGDVQGLIVHLLCGQHVRSVGLDCAYRVLRRFTCTNCSCCKNEVYVQPVSLMGLSLCDEHLYTLVISSHICNMKLYFYCNGLYSQAYKCSQLKHAHFLTMSDIASLV